MTSRSLVLAVAVLSACGGDDGTSLIDSGNRADAAPSCPAPETPLAAGMHKLYVVFDGVTITLGDCDDSKTNCSSLVTQSSTAVPPFQPGVGDPATRIATIKGMVQESLAPFSIDVVTARPASGDYRMIVVGGASTLVTASEGGTAAKPTCQGTNTNSIAFVFENDDDQFTDRGYADTIAGAFGRVAGLVPVTRSGDCMCIAGTCAHSQTCTWGTNIVPPVGNACSRMSQNEQLLMMTAVGCRG
jgi:hypothetical protein